MRALCVVCGCLFLVGCHLPAQMSWSPDGSKAGYRVNDQFVIINADGKMLTPVQKSIGGMAWTADSKTLYFASMSDEESILPAGQLGKVSDQWARPGDLPEPGESRMVVSSWQEAADPKKAGPIALFTLPDHPVWHLAVSPDQEWLAVIQAGSAKGNDCSLYAFHLPSKTLYTLSATCGLPMCFTGANRLAFVEPQTKPGCVENGAGFVVEVQLKHDAPAPERRQLINVVCDKAFWMQPIGDDLLFTAVPMNFPSRVTDAPDHVGKLFTWSRANNGICAIADDIGPFFSLSPDGKQILVEKVSLADNQISKRELTLIKPNGSDGRVLRDITPTPDLPLWPSWRGNSEIVFCPPVDINKPQRVDADGRVRFDAVLYKLTETFDLQPIKTLSESWPPELKPFYKVQPAPSTAPTTLPVSFSPLIRTGT